MKHREHTHTTAVVCVKISRDSRKLVSTGQDGSIYIWTFQAPSEDKAVLEKGDGDKNNVSKTTAQNNSLKTPPLTPQKATSTKPATPQNIDKTACASPKVACLSSQKSC